jgi:hypothetical protein
MGAATGIPFINASQTDWNLIGAGYTFTNVSQRPISAVRFAFRELDTLGDGPEYGVFVYDWHGDMQPGASYAANAAQGYTSPAVTSRAWCAPFRRSYSLTEASGAPAARRPRRPASIIHRLHRLRRSEPGMTKPAAPRMFVAKARRA